MNNKHIKILMDPTETTGAVNKQYVDKQISRKNVKPSKSGWIFTVA